MDRYAIFVDAGYVYAAGGNLVLDTDNRAQVVLDAEGFLTRLQDIVRQDHPDSGDFLRIYWYDASPRGLPTAEHEAIGAIQGVKVRLGRLTEIWPEGRRRAGHARHDAPYRQARDLHGVPAHG